VVVVVVVVVAIVVIFVVVVVVVIVVKVACVPKSMNFEILFACLIVCVDIHLLCHTNTTSWRDLKEITKLRICSNLKKIHTTNSLLIVAKFVRQ
jgi:hypothetical protein